MGGGPARSGRSSDCHVADPADGAMALGIMAQLLAAAAALQPTAPANSRFWKWRGYNIRYTALGDDQSGPAVLMVHGLFVNAGEGPGGDGHLGIGRRARAPRVSPADPLPQITTVATSPPSPPPATAPTPSTSSDTVPMPKARIT